MIVNIALMIFCLILVVATEWNIGLSGVIRGAAILAAAGLAWHTITLAEQVNSNLDRLGGFMDLLR